MLGVQARDGVSLPERKWLGQEGREDGGERPSRAMWGHALSDTVLGRRELGNPGHSDSPQGSQRAASGLSVRVSTSSGGSVETWLRGPGSQPRHQPWDLRSWSPAQGCSLPGARARPEPS